MVSQPRKATGCIVSAHRTVSVCTKGRKFRRIEVPWWHAKRTKSNSSFVQKGFSDLLSTLNYELIELPSTSDLAVRGRGIEQCRGQRLTLSPRPVADVLFVPRFFKKWIWGVFRWGAWTLQTAAGPTTPHLAQLTHLCHPPGPCDHRWFQPLLKLNPDSRGRNSSARILASLMSQLCDLELVASVCFERPPIPLL